MPDDRKKNKHTRKKNLENKKDDSPEGKITIGEVVKVSDNQEQRKKDVNKSGPANQSRERNMQQE